MRADKLRHQPDILIAGQGEQHDRQIAGKRLSPETGLSAAVGGHGLRIAAQFLTGENQRTGQTVIQSRVVFGGIQLAQHHLTVRPGDFEYPISNMMVTVFFQQHQALQPCVGNAVHHIDNHWHAGFQGNALADGHHRIQHRTGAVSERSALTQGLRAGRGIAASDKGRPVSFERRFPFERAVDRHHMEHPRTLFFRFTRTAVAQNPFLCGHQFGLHKQIAERRMCGVIGGWRQYHFGIGGDFQLTRTAAMMRNRHAADFDVIFRRNHDVGLHGQRTLCAFEFRTEIVQHRVIGAFLFAERLPGIAVDRAGLRIAEIAENPAIIACCIFPPAGQRQVFPAADAATGLRHHQMVIGVRQQLNFRRGTAGVGEFTQLNVHFLQRVVMRLKVATRAVKLDGIRHPFLQQQACRLERGIGGEACGHRRAQQHIAQRQETHSLMVSHVRAHHDVNLAADQTRRAVIQRVVKAIFATRTAMFQYVEIETGFLRADHQRHHGGIRRDHHVFTKTALQAQTGHAERVILIILIEVKCRISGFRNPPRHAVFLTPGDLPVNGGLTHLHQQGIRIGRHHQLRHQVFKHRSAPRHQRRLFVDHGEQASERKPAFLRQLVGGNGDVVGQTNFRRQQIVFPAVQFMRVAVISDGQQMGILVVQEAEIHARMVIKALFKLADNVQTLPCQTDRAGKRRCRTGILLRQPLQ